MAGITDHATHDQQSLAALSDAHRGGQRELVTLGVPLEDFLQRDGCEADSLLKRAGAHERENGKEKWRELGS